MDTLTHGIAGSVCARALADRPGARAAMLLGLVAAMLPDLDILFLTRRLDYLRDHRSWSHSFVYLPLFALGLALLGKLLFRRARLSTLWIFAAIGLASHILFDWITSFGTMFWTPISRARYSLDWVFILDPFFTGIVAATLLGAAIFRPRGRSIAIGGAAALAAYLALCAGLHARALEMWRSLDEPPPGTTVAVLPQFLSPFRWLGLSDREGEVHAAFFDIGPFAKGKEDPLPPRASPKLSETIGEIFRSLSDFYPPPSRARIRRFEKPPRSAALDAAMTLPDVAVYLDFARFPLATVEAERSGATAITFEDLRFLPWFSGPWGRSRGGGIAKEAFVYRVRLDGAGRPLDRGFVVRGRPS